MPTEGPRNDHGMPTEPAAGCAAGKATGRPREARRSEGGGGPKPGTDREAVARGSIRMAPATVRAIRRGAVTKGDPLQAARIAGIMAAKRTADLGPLCHPPPIT